MSIKRTALSVDKNFTIVPNAWLRDGRLSLRARGLLAQIMSHSVGWDITVDSLVRVNPEGRDAIRNAINELIGAGYLERDQERADGNKFGNMTYVIAEPSPVTENPTTETPTSEKAPTKKTISSEDHPSGKNSAPEGAPSKPKPRKGYTDDFEQWWKHYPSSRNKADAYTEYQKALREHTPEELLRLLHGWNAGRKRDAASRRDGWVEAPPYAERWLKKRRWEDYAQAVTITRNGVAPAPPQMSKDEVDQILGGKDYWSCPAPPPGLTIPEEMAWKRERMNEHLESRRIEAMEKLNA